MDAPPEHKPKREYRKTGLFTLRHQLIDLGSRAIDGRSSVGVALRKWREDLINDLGGRDAISTQMETLIELATRSKIMLDSIDNWILGQSSLVNVRKKTILSVVQQRQTIADGLVRVLDKLGIQRVTPPAKWPWELDSDQDKQADEKRDESETGSESKGDESS